MGTSQISHSATQQISSSQYQGLIRAARQRSQPSTRTNPGSRGRSPLLLTSPRIKWPGGDHKDMRKPRVDQRGFGFIEIVIVLAVVAVAGYLLLQYFGSTAKTLEKFQEERPIAHAKLAADQATLDAIKSMVQVYQAQN